MSEHVQPQTGKNVRTQEDSLKTHGFKKTQQQQRFGADVTLSDWLGRLGEARGLKQQAVIVQELLAATSGQSLAASRISPLVEQYGARALAEAIYETGTLKGASARLSREPCKIAAGRSTPGLTKKQIRFYMQQLQIAAPTCNELAELAWIHQPGYLAAWAAWFAGQRKYGPGWVIEQIRAELWPPQREDGPGAGREAVAAEILRRYETEIGLITPEVFSEILSDIETFDLRDRELVDRAFARAVEQGVREWASVRQICLELRREAAPASFPETSRAGPAPLWPVSGRW